RGRRPRWASRNEFPYRELSRISDGAQWRRSGPPRGGAGPAFWSGNLGTARSGQHPNGRFLSVHQVGGRQRDLLPRLDDRDRSTVAAPGSSRNRSVAGGRYLLSRWRHRSAVLQGRDRLRGGRREFGGPSSNELREVRRAGGNSSARELTREHHVPVSDRPG